MGLIKCAIFMAAIGVFSFILGRLLPASWFCEDRFPYRSFSWEKSGAIYNALAIRKWQNKVPDMSKIFPKLMLEKKVSANFREELPMMIKETCIAEFIHVLLCVAGVGFIPIWRGAGGIVVFILYVLANIPFILIQRYNRPRLIRLQTKITGSHS